MKYFFKIIYIGIFLMLTSYKNDSGFDKTNCTFNGKKLYGKIRYVNVNPDVKVRLVDYNEDIRIIRVTSNAYRCGQWEVVQNNEDIKVELVNNNENIKVLFVNASEGIPNQ